MFARCDVWAKEPAENIADIWTTYHNERADSLGTVIPGDALVDLQKKAKKWWVEVCK